MNTQSNNRTLVGRSSQDPVNVRRRDRAKLTRDTREEYEEYAMRTREENEEFENELNEIYGQE